jgi:hypothetical protein
MIKYIRSPDPPPRAQPVAVVTEQQKDEVIITSMPLQAKRGLVAKEE